MLRPSVRVRPLVVAAALAAACTDARVPLQPATPPTAALVARVDPRSVPIALGVHTATLPGLDGPTVTVGGINDWAEVVGTMGSQAFHWQLTRGVTLLTAPGIQSSQAANVNQTAHVAVTVQTDSGQRVAIWDWSNSLHQLRVLSSFSFGGENFPFCYAAGINNNEQVLGTCFVYLSGTYVPTIWSPSGRPDGFGGPNGIGPGNLLFGEVDGYSNRGYVAGRADLGIGTPDGFIVSPAGIITMLPNGTAKAVNDGGDAVGMTYISNAAAPQPPCDDALVWFQGQPVQDLGVCGMATGITDDRIVIGTVTDSSGLNALFAFVWTSADGLHRLPGLNATGAGETSSAVAINDQHQIVGSIISSGQQHAVMWTLPTQNTGTQIAGR
jgi:uncharacterized membrane protein